MDEERYRCPIHFGYLCFHDGRPFDHNIRLKPGEPIYHAPKRDHEFIYRIIHIRTGMCYVGRTEKSMSDRWAGHRSARKLPARGDDPLYRAMNEDGLQMFVMEELEECGNSIARERELDWMRGFDSWNPVKGYNKPSAETVYARNLYFLLYPSEKPKYEELRDNLRGLHQGLRGSLPGDQKLEEELQRITDRFLRKGPRLMKMIASLASPVIFKRV